MCGLPGGVVTEVENWGHSQCLFLPLEQDISSLLFMPLCLCAAIMDPNHLGQFSIRGSLKTIFILDIYIAIHNSSKNTVNEIAMKIILCLGVTTTWENVLKGYSIRKTENHCSRTLCPKLNAFLDELPWSWCFVSAIEKMSFQEI